MKTLKDLLIHEIKDLYSAEDQLVDAMPEMMKAATNEKLKSSIEEHLKETKEQRERLKKACEHLGVKPEGETCKAMAGLIKEAKDMIKEDAEDEVKDAGIIAEAQRIEHYEIAGYGSACTFAEMLGEDKVLELLKKTLSEEKDTDEKLSKLAKQKLNKKAMA